jgi:hypothetical protein
VASFNVQDQRPEDNPLEPRLRRHAARRKAVCLSLLATQPGHPDSEWRREYQSLRESGPRCKDALLCSIKPPCVAIERGDIFPGSGRNMGMYGLSQKGFFDDLMIEPTMQKQEYVLNTNENKSASDLELYHEIHRSRQNDYGSCYLYFWPIS